MASLNLKNLAIAAAVTLTAATGFTANAYAGEPVKVAAGAQDEAAKAKAECLKKLDGVASKSICGAIEGAKLEEQKRAVDAQGKALDAQGLAEDKLARCIAVLKEAKAGGAKFEVKITRENACDIASKYGKQAAAGSMPAL